MQQQPGGGVLDEAGNIEQHLRLQARRDAIVERLDIGPGSAQLEGFAHDAIGASDLSRPFAGTRPHVVNERDAGAVDEVVCNDGRGDLAP